MNDLNLGDILISFIIYFSTILYNKITAENTALKSMLKLNIFGSLTYLEIKNCPIVNINDLHTLRNQLEVLICMKSLSKVQARITNGFRNIFLANAKLYVFLRIYCICAGPIIVCRRIGPDCTHLI